MVIFLVVAVVAALLAATLVCGQLVAGCPVVVVVVASLVFLRPQVRA